MKHIIEKLFKSEDTSGVSDDTISVYETPSEPPKEKIIVESEYTVDLDKANVLEMIEDYFKKKELPYKPKEIYIFNMYKDLDIPYMKIKCESDIVEY